MKKIICAFLFIGGLLGAEVASADPHVSGAVSFGDRNVAGTVYLNQPPVYYGYPAPAYYARPVYYGSYYRHHHHHQHWGHHHGGHHHGHHNHHGGHGGHGHHGGHGGHHKH